MLRLFVLFASLLSIALISIQTHASNNGTAACETLPEPFRQLATMTLDPAVGNPLKLGSATVLLMLKSTTQKRLTIRRFKSWKNISQALVREAENLLGRVTRLH